ncbi:MAG: DUF2975 domain-containing protein [Clostridia bacterium]|nr:DUF2975 domain-containing protein [Clostridia bacterium]
MAKLLHSRRVLAGLLKAVVIFVFAALLMIGLVPVPRFAHLAALWQPGLAPLVPWGIVYVNLGFVLVYAALVLAWRVFAAIGRDESFSRANGRRLRKASALALGEAGWLVIGLIWLQWAQVLGGFYRLVFGGLILLALSAAVVLYVLGYLIDQAAQLKEEADLTI